MVLSENRLPDLSFRRLSKQRQFLILKTLTIFARCFPEIKYEFAEQSDIINAQAVTLLNIRSVYLHGGLAFHPLVDRQLLIFILLHETGHHLSSGCRLPWDHRLACECEADHWAVTEGALALRACDGTNLNLNKLVRQMGLFAKDLDGDTSVSKTKRHRGCWAYLIAQRANSISRKQSVKSSICLLS